MSLESLNDLIWWAVGSGWLFGGNILQAFGIGGGGSAPKYPIAQINKIARENTRAIQGDTFGRVDPGTIRRTGNKKDGFKFEVVNKNGKVLKTFKDKDKAQEFVDNRKGDPKQVQPLVPSVAEEGQQLIARVDDLISSGKAELNEEESTLLARLDGYASTLKEAQDKEDASLLADLSGLNEDLKKGMDLLNEKDKAEFEKELAGFQSSSEQILQTYRDESTAETDRASRENDEALAKYKDERTADIAAREGREFEEGTKFTADTETLGDQFRKEGERLDQRYRDETLGEESRRTTEGAGIIGRFDEETKDVNNRYRDETTANIDRSESDFKTLGDTYLSMTDASKSDYDARLEDALNLSPERLAEFTSAYDFIAKATFQTNQDLLATADPRALELAAIADENAAAMMSGRIGADVQANLARSSAMRALQGGFGASSAMGQGLTARDLGLTSLDLMQQGTKMYDAQRRLNYDTRVAGIAQATGTSAGQMLSNDQTLRKQGAADLLGADNIRNATFFEVGQRNISDILNQRNTSAFNAADQSRLSLTERQRAELDQLNKSVDGRSAVFLNSLTSGRQDAQTLYNAGRDDRRLVYGSNLAAIRYGAERFDNTLNTGLAGTLANINTRKNDNLGIYQNVMNAGMDTNRVGFAAQIGNRDQRTAREANNLTNTWDRNFQNRVGIYNTRVGTDRSIYGTNVNAAGNIFSTNADSIYRNTALGAAAATQATNNDVTARLAGFEALTNARSQSAATRADATQNKWAADNARYASGQDSKNALWGSILQAGSTIAGTAIGAAAGNPFAGYQVGSLVGNTFSGGGGGGGSNMFSNLIGVLGNRNTTGFDNQWGMYGKNMYQGTGYGNFDDFGNV